LQITTNTVFPDFEYGTLASKTMRFYLKHCPST